MTPIEQLPVGQDNKLPIKAREALIALNEEQRRSQEQATFNRALSQDKWFFRVRMAMGVVAICSIPAVITICSLIIFDPHQDLIIKRVAESALFFSLIGFMSYVWRIFLTSAAVSRLRPVTTTEELSSATADQPSTRRGVNRNSISRTSRNGADSRGTGR